MRRLSSATFSIFSVFGMLAPRHMKNASADTRRRTTLPRCLGRFPRRGITLPPLLSAATCSLATPSSDCHGEAAGHRRERGAAAAAARPGGAPRGLLLHLGSPRYSRVETTA